MPDGSPEPSISSLGMRTAPTTPSQDEDYGLSPDPRMRFTPRPSPPSSPTVRTASKPSARMFHPDASVALVGIRGTGRSTLAVMASTALGFRLLDADRYFFQTTGLSRAAYKAQYGPSGYLQAEVKLLRSMLIDNPTRTIVVCGPGAVEGTGRTWLFEYAQSHPVIYVLRNPVEIGNYLGLGDARDVRRLLHLTGPTYRFLSNYEFHNLSMTGSEAQDTSTAQDHLPKSLVLKHVEQDFVQFVCRITGRDLPYPSSLRTRAEHTPSQPEHTPFTYCLAVPLFAVEAAGLALRDMDETADRVHLEVSPHDMRQRFPEFDDAAKNFLTLQYYLLKGCIKGPLGITVDDGRSATSSQSAYQLQVLYHCLRLAPEYLCTDLDLGEKPLGDIIAARGPTSIVGVYHDTSQSASGWRNPMLKDMAHYAERMGCHAVRIYRRAQSREDNFDARDFRKAVAPTLRIPLVVNNTGPHGRFLYSINQVFMPVTDPVLRSFAPDMVDLSLLTIREAQQALYSSYVLDPMYFGIFGNNVSRSLSPAMHNAGYAASGMPHVYKPFEFHAIDQIRQFLSDKDFGGMTVVSPFKEEVVALVDFASPEAHAIGAINTLVPLRTPNLDSLAARNRRGPVMALFGDNTDWIGVTTCVRHNLSPINTITPRTTALVVGAGGMARASVYALLRLGVQNIYVHNRTAERAEDMLRHFSSYCHKHGNLGWPCSGSEERGRGSADVMGAPPTMGIIASKDDPWPENTEYPTIIVSCIALREVDGVADVDTSLPIGWFASPTGGVAIELAYVPLNTPLMRQVKGLASNGWIAVDGLKVVPEQVFKQFELFTARKAPTRAMKRVLEVYLINSSDEKTA
ncbi:Quinate repressor protein [Colletotrichum orbiculare MAFF 240422]|uniref:Quinate repressor protein n=1 Tax=Colletotrichum orbiculare (strain 104-T / ATCC 96160 / CBS 514.97 / LARS 414 / MAFF 240422) TaxID=1213857 RepID=N4UPR0_COLOR|nr:Quinate repressor protein [Colletotrichum orbiculare MAFF 240422]